MTDDLFRDDSTAQLLPFGTPCEGCERTKTHVFEEGGVRMCAWCWDHSQQGEHEHKERRRDVD